MSHGKQGVETAVENLIREGNSQGAVMFVTGALSPFLVEFIKNPNESNWETLQWFSQLIQGVMAVNTREFFDRVETNPEEAGETLDRLLDLMKPKGPTP